jgi:RNA polymerase sigma factor (sigma-70 family)
MPIAWESLLARYQELARNLAAGLLGRRDEADDVVQEAMLALVAAERAQPGRFATLEHARNYLLKTVRNLSLERRERRRDPAQLAEGDAPARGDAGELDDWRERVAGLERAVEQLDPAGRELFESRFRARKTLAQIASETGVPISTLHSREKALLERLRRALERGGGAA